MRKQQLPFIFSSSNYIATRPAAAASVLPPHPLLRCNHENLQEKKSLYSPFGNGRCSASETAKKSTTMCELADSIHRNE